MKKLLLSGLVLLVLKLLIPVSVQAASISGSIMNLEGNPLAEPIAVGYFDGENWMMEIFEEGEYLFPDVQDGRYIVKAGSPEGEGWYYTQYYPDVTDEGLAQWIDVFGEVAGIDFSLEQGGYIEGSVEPEDGGEFEPYQVFVELYVANENFYEPVMQDLVEDPANVISPLLPPGEYTVKFTSMPPSMYVPTFYGNTWNIFEAENIRVMPGETTSGIDVLLPIGGAVSGNVTGNGDPLPNCGIAIYLPAMGPMGFFYPFSWGYTDEAGDYMIQGIPEGQCLIQVLPEDGMYAPEWYDDANSPFTATNVDIVASETTVGIDVELELGTVISGTIRDINNQIPTADEVYFFFYDDKGNETGRDIEIDDQGNWQMSGRLNPGQYSLYINTTNMQWANMYYGGTPFVWQAEWFQADAGSETSLDIVLQPGSAMGIQFLDPEGEQLNEPPGISLYYNGNELTNFTGVGIGGGVSIDNLFPGQYIVMVKGDYDGNGGQFDPNHLWHTRYSGNANFYEDAETVEVTTGNTAETVIQMAEGGAIKINVSDPQGDIYDAMGSNVGVFLSAIGPDGKPMFYQTGYGTDPFDENDERYIVLPEGSYKVLGAPVYAEFSPGMEAPPVRRTFYGGSYEIADAEMIEVNTGDITEVDLQMVESGHSIAGRVITAERTPASFVLIGSDQTGLLTSAFVNISFLNAFENEFKLKGMADGGHYLMAELDGQSPLVTTWHPDVATPGMLVDRINVPQGAVPVSVNNADAQNVRIVMQYAHGYNDVPLIDVKPASPSTHILYGAYPNPFNSMAQVVFGLLSDQDVKVTLHDVMGRKVVDVASGRYSAGSHSVLLRGDGLAAGTYLIKLQAGNFEMARKVVLIK